MNFPEVGVPSLAFVQLLESQALHPDADARFRSIMVREEIDEATLMQAEGQAPLRWFREVYPDLDTDQAVRLGHTFAEQAQLTSFGPLSVPLVSAGSVAEIVELLTYLPLISTALSTQFHPRDDGVAVGLTGNAGDPELNCLLVTYCGLALRRLIEMLIGDASTVALHVSWPTPASWADHPDVLAGRLFFDAPLSFLHVPIDTLTEVCKFPDPIAYRLAIAKLRQKLDDRSQPKSFAHRVRTLLEEGSRLTSCQSVADALSISTSTVKRRLADEGTTFRELLETSLRERATLKLLDPSLSVTDIAHDLGYSDLTNFSHAFKRWTGRPPTQFRDEHQDN